MEPYAENLSVESEFKYLLMLKAYVDDSGSDGKSIPYLLAGFLFAPEHCAAFAEDWHSQLRREPSIEYFKMHEAHRYSGEFAKPEFRQKEVRKRKVCDLLELIESVAPAAFYSAVNWPEFRLLQEPYVTGPAKNPYHCLVPWLLDAIIAWQHLNEGFPTPVDFVFDEQGSVLSEALRVYPKVKARMSEPVQIVMGETPKPGDEKRILPLQAADMLVGTLRRHFDPDRNDEWEWLYERMKPLCTEGAFTAHTSEGMQIWNAWQEEVQAHV